ncbi:MAG TPA: Na(+)-translocating NADH-quinone reductase subunit A [Candidatus Marinimicrobia bacterium]|nr:Na(+)-translocating NADH-quinone reductase subunit A [Candidatus Neomarinimicrobiota bacterium]
MLIKIKKGLNLPIAGAPEQVIYPAQSVSQVALLGLDYVGLKPQFAVTIGDQVKLGQPLFSDKTYPQIRFTAPGTGQVIAINRGPKRAFLSLVIKLDGDDAVEFKSFSEQQIDSLTREEIINQLLESGLWPSFKARPFGKLADPESQPHSIFVTAMDTNPLAPDVAVILREQANDFQRGLALIAKLTAGKVFVCQAPDTAIPIPEIENIEIVEFAGPHPAGLAGTHIHFLAPVSLQKTVWSIDAQDVAAIGKLFTTGRLPTARIVALAGSAVKKPRLIATRVGANLSELTDGELAEGHNRIISGSVLAGHTAAGELNFLGRFHQIVSVIPEGGRRKLFGWLSLGTRLFSVKNITLSAFLPNRKLVFDTDTHGSERAIVPIGSYEKVMPLDILPTYLLRALAVDDLEEAEKLGCLELVEEDLALCTFVCPSKIDHGQNLRRVLNLIEKEG